MKNKLTIISAVSQNNIIGGDNKLLWHLPNDLKRFKALTLGNPIVMGRKTFESFGGKPLPKRPNIVLTKDVNFTHESDLVKVFHSKKDILKYLENFENPFVIGGRQIYKLFLEDANYLEITRVHKDFKGDTEFVKVDYSKWNLMSEEFHSKDEKNKYDYTFESYKRK